MIKLTVLYGKPTDPAAFEDYYRNTHVPLADQIPNMTRPLEWGKALPSIDGSEVAHFWIASLTFADNDAVMGALGSPQGQAAVGDVANFASGGATMVLSEY